MCKVNYVTPPPEQDYPVVLGLSWHKSEKPYSGFHGALAGSGPWLPFASILCHSLRSQPQHFSLPDTLPDTLWSHADRPFRAHLPEAGCTYKKQLLLLCYSSFYPACGALWPLACPSRALHIVTDTVPGLHQPVEVTGASREMACH